MFSPSDRTEQVRARVLYCMSSFAAVKGDYQKAINYIEEGLNIDERLNDKPMVAADCRKLATIYDRINQIDKAVSYFDKSIDLSSSIGDEKNEAETLYQLGMFYLRKNRNEAGMQTIEKVLSIARRIGHQKLIANCLGSTGEYHLQYGDADKAVEAVTQSLEICRQIGTPQYLEAGLCRLGMAQMKTGEYDKAEASLLEALEMSRQLEDKYPTAFDLMILGDLNRERKKYMEAGVYYEQSVERCLELQNYNMLSVIYDKLYQIHRDNNPALSLEWLEKGILVDDSLYNLGMHNQISAFQIEYETEKKEMQITTLEEEKRLVIWLGIAGGALLLLTLAAFFLLWRWTVQKKRLAESQRELAEQEKHLAEQQIKQLEQEKQLIATQAVLDGEVQERIRLARDLHDSLGSILAAAKYNLLDIKQISMLGEKDVECYNKAVSLLDDSMNEMRRVAHHLMPDALSRFGLKPAIGDFCDTLPAVQFVWYGDESRLDAKQEEVVYRIIHELISNALKHSGASHIFVQVIQELNRIAFTVQDDGGGFDPETVSTGMGLSNIRIRVTSFGGIINIDSKAGEGTEINIEFPLKVEDAHKTV
ncbi:MAG: tetratricopeptide repeat protein [Bacteroidales bacterium]|nr:tetratricopeptide repeat protein [Bacteroidales bacterium]